MVWRSIGMLTKGYNMKLIRDIKELTKGQKVRVTDNEIFDIMGYEEVTGTVFVLNPNRDSFSILCDQTGAIELVTLKDSVIEAI